MDINDIRCVMEGLILPALAWLARVLGGKKKAAAESLGGDEGRVEPQGPVAHEPLQAEPGEPMARELTPEGAMGGGAWATHFEKQAALQGAATGIVAQPAMAAATGSATTGEAPARRPGRPRWLRDFGPGALGALLVTAGFVVALPFLAPATTAEDKETIKALVFVELLCLPVSLVAGALIGVLGSLLTKVIARAVQLGERAQAVSSTIVAVVSGAVTGVLWDLFVLLGSFF